jgi:anti-sigma factor RsiW
MCDYSGKLVAWIDGELPEGEAADVEGHLGACDDCRKRLAAYQQVSSTFDAYCQATLAAEARHPNARRWAAAARLAGAIAGAAAIAVLLMLSRQRVAHAPAGATIVAGSSHAAGQAEDAPHVAVPTQAIVDVNTAQHAASATKKVRSRYAGPGAPTENGGNETSRAASPASPMENAGEFPAEPPIQIDIPAEAMFPPGAVPPGMRFTADLTIASDGSPERLGLRPRLAGFERRTNQP